MCWPVLGLLLPSADFQSICIWRGQLLCRRPGLLLLLCCMVLPCCCCRRGEQRVLLYVNNCILLWLYTALEPTHEGSSLCGLQ